MDCVSLPYSAIHYLYSLYDHYNCDQKEEALRTFNKKLIPVFGFYSSLLPLPKCNLQIKHSDLREAKKWSRISRSIFQPFISLINLKLIKTLPMAITIMTTPRS